MYKGYSFFIAIFPKHNNFMAHCSLQHFKAFSIFQHNKQILSLIYMYTKCCGICLYANQGKNMLCLVVDI